MTNFLFLLILLGSLQGIIMGSILVFGKPREYPGKLLGLLIWVIALPGIHLYLHHTNFFNGELVPDLLHAWMPWMMISTTGALLYFYLRSILDPVFRISRKHLIWFLPLVIDLFPKILELSFMGQLIPSSLIPDRASLAGFLDGYNRYADLPRWAAVAYGVAVSYKLLRDYQIRSVAAGAPQPQLVRWLRQFVNVFGIFMMLWFVYLIPYLLPRTAGLLESTVGWFPVYLPMAVMIYWLGLKGIRSTRPALQEPVRDLPRPVPTAQMKDLVEKLVALMESGKPYLDPLLDLSSLSKISGIPAKQISAALNQQMGKSFTLFLNEYRVREFTSRATDATTLTIAGMAAECGFPSLATFQRVFKQVTGQTPSEHLRKQAS